MPYYSTLKRISPYFSNRIFFIEKRYASTLSFWLSPLHHLFAVDDLQLRHDDALSKKRGKRREATDGRFPVLGFIARKARSARLLQRPRIVYKPRTDTLLVYARNSSRSSLAAHVALPSAMEHGSSAERKSKWCKCSLICDSDKAALLP